MKRLTFLILMFVLCGILSQAQTRKPKSLTFDARHELKVMIPEGTKKVRIWFALPQEAMQQQVANLKIESPLPYRIERDMTEGSRFLYVEANAPTSKEVTLVTSFRLTRNEVLSNLQAAKARPLSKEEKKKLARYLGPNQYVVIDDNVRRMAKEIVGNEKNPLLAARKIYDYVLNYVDYWVIDPANLKASPVGSTEYCLATKTGNCTDFQSLWTSLARAAGIPTRIVYGSFFKKELDGKDVDQSYHCWTEFYISNLGWISQDVSVADLFAQDIKMNDQNTTLVQRTTPAGYFGKDTRQVDYYFGNLDERRVTWSIGRDLKLTPAQAAGPVNAIAKAYVEIDGQVAKEGAANNWVRKLTYVEVK
jgi:hypothetical protein